MTDAPVADVAQAAKELQQCLVDYRIDPAMQLDRETGLLHNFIADLETKYAAQVTKLGLTLFVAPLKEANTKVEQFIVNRTTAQSAVAAGELRSARLATDAAYRHLVKFVNALAMVSGTTDYDALAKFLNEHIDRYKHEVLPKKKKGGKKLRMATNPVTVENPERERSPMARSRAVMLQSRVMVAMARINRAMVKISRAAKVRAML